METIKVIDLFNKIANGEEVPKKIKYKTWTFIYVDEFYGYMKENYLTTPREEIISFNAYIVSMEELNDEVEIIEEKSKIPEKIDLYKSDDTTIKGLVKTINVMFEDTTNKINELIDYLESKEKGDE